MCSQTEVGVDMYPEVTNRGYRQHQSTADTYWRSRDLLLSSTRSTPKARIQDDTSSKQVDTLSARLFTSLG